MDKPTKRTQFRYSTNGDQEITETEDKCSVELKMLAKGGILIESVKVFANSEQEAGDRALALLLRLQDVIDAAAEKRLQDQLRRSASAAGVKA